jgi:dephospho-CoA kinase
MIKLGLTGGIGSGKSTISRLFNLLGVPVFDSDREAKSLYKVDNELKNEIIKQFGKEAYLDNGEISRHFMVSQVFSNKQKLDKLNSIVHPRVKNRFDDWLKSFSDYPLVIKEAAILFESGANKQVDKVLLVVAPIEIRIDRVIKRDGITIEKVMERIKNQWPQEELVKKADYIIDNSGIISVIKQVNQVYKEILSIS